MNIPNIPTDNLYKFLAISGLIIFIFFTYFAESTKEKYLNEFYILDKDNKILTLEKSVVSNDFDKQLEIKKDSLELENRYTFLSKNWDKFIHKRFKLYFWLGFLGTSISIFGFIMWYLKTQKYQNEIIKNEAYKSAIQRKQFQHNLQYENELNSYKQIWKNLYALKLLINGLYKYYEKYVDGDSRYKARIADKLDELKKKYRPLISITFELEPFLPKEFVDQVRKSQKALIEFAQDFEDLIYLYKTYDESFIYLKELKRNFDIEYRSIRDLIRKRINLIEETETNTKEKLEK